MAVLESNGEVNGFHWITIGARSKKIGQFSRNVKRCKFVRDEVQTQSISLSFRNGINESRILPHSKLVTKEPSPATFTYDEFY